jgi:O-methyltransferase
MSDYLEIPADRRLIGYGATLAFLGTQETNPLPLEYLVDDTPDFVGKTLHGLEIRPSEALAEEDPDQVFVIQYAFRPDSLQRMGARLRTLGLRFKVHYVDCSMLHAASMLPRMRDLGLQPSIERFATCHRLTLYNRPRNISGIAGTWLWIELAERASRLQGQVFECGAYEGGNAYVSLMASQTFRQRPYHLLDTWSGLPEVSAADPAEREGDFGDVDFASIQDMFSEFPNVSLQRGLFESNLPKLLQDPVSLAYIDCDLYEGAKASCEMIWPKLPTGGAMLFHDYWVSEETLPSGARAPFTGIKPAVDEFFRARDIDVHVFPETTHALAIKP